MQTTQLSKHYMYRPLAVGEGISAHYNFTNLNGKWLCFCTLTQRSCKTIESDTVICYPNELLYFTPFVHQHWLPLNANDNKGVCIQVTYFRHTCNYYFELNLCQLEHWLNLFNKNTLSSPFASYRIDEHQ